MRIRPFLTLLRPSRALLIAALVLTSCAGPVPAAKTAAVVAKAAPPPPAPPPLALVPVDVARTGLVATFVIPSLDRSLSSGVALIKQAAPLPLDPAGVRDMLLAQSGLPAEVGKHLDLTAPVAGAVVAAGPGRSPLTAFTFAAKSATDVTALLAALGRKVARRGAAVQIENTSGDRGWFLPMGNVVAFADSDEALVRAGSLAVEARQGPKDDVSVVVYPDMLAQVADTAVKTALGRLIGEIEDRAAASGNKLGPEAGRQVRDLADYAADVATAEFALDLDAGRGASVLARLRPRAGSKLEGVARFTKTIALDPLLLRAVLSGKEDATFLVTSAYGARTLEQVRRQRAKLPAGGGKGLLAAGRLLDAFAEGLTGELSMVGRLQPGLSGELIYPARDAAGAARIQSALAANDKDAIAAIVRAATQGEGLDVKVHKARQENIGKIRVLHASLGFVLRGDTKGALRKLIGPAGLEVFVAVVGGDRLAVTMGQGAKARMVGIVSGQGPKDSQKGPPATMTPALSEALAASGARSLFYFFDLRQAIALALTFGGDARLRLLSGTMRAPMPILGGATGDAQGKALTLDLTIPPACFSGMGALVQAAMMMRN